MFAQLYYTLPNFTQLYYCTQIEWCLQHTMCLFNKRYVFFVLHNYAIKPFLHIRESGVILGKFGSLVRPFKSSAKDI